MSVSCPNTTKNTLYYKVFVEMVRLRSPSEGRINAKKLFVLNEAEVRSGAAEPEPPRELILEAQEVMTLNRGRFAPTGLHNLRRTRVLC